MSNSSNAFELNFTARPDNLILGREVCGALLEFWGADRVLIDDVKTALTEACDNAIIHGYVNSDEGQITIFAAGSSEAIELTVQDRGDGFALNPELKGGLGMGLPLIATLSDQYEISGRPGGGTEVRMSFGLNSTPAALSPRLDQDESPKTLGSAHLTTDLHALIPRFILAAGSGTNLDVDRLSDLQLTVDLALEALQPGVFAWVQVDAASRGVDFSLGPLDGDRVNLSAIRRLTQKAEIEEVDSVQVLLTSLSESDPVPQDR